MQFTIILLIVAVTISQAARLPTSSIKPLPSTSCEKLVQIRGGSLVSKETFVKVSTKIYAIYQPTFKSLGLIVVSFNSNFPVARTTHYLDRELYTRLTWGQWPCSAFNS